MYMILCHSVYIEEGTGHNLPGIASQFATQNPGFVMHCSICVAYIACMLHSRVTVQALIRVEIDTQNNKSKVE